MYHIKHVQINSYLHLRNLNLSHSTYGCTCSKKAESKFFNNLSLASQSIDSAFFAEKLSRDCSSLSFENYKFSRMKTEKKNFVCLSIMFICFFVSGELFADLGIKETFAVKLHGRRLLMALFSALLGNVGFQT